MHEKRTFRRKKIKKKFYHHLKKSLGATTVVREHISVAREHISSHENTFL